MTLRMSGNWSGRLVLRSSGMPVIAVVIPGVPAVIVTMLVVVKLRNDVGRRTALGSER